MVLFHTGSPRMCLGCDCPNYYTPFTILCDEQTDTGPTFDSLLRSNDPPSPSEECQLRDSISMGEARVAAIDDHVAALQQALASIGAELEDLDGEREKVLAHIAEYKRLLSPVRRLPHEIDPFQNFLQYNHLSHAAIPTPKRETLVGFSPY
ncbi:hypothetical protein ARMGADRAFT_1081899 [Armillaria gallica]|uniref:Uncharacterized protein n=1 Tax=Armillaria gallica TaxID=47427 RepID=A0A2H3DC97_ARMGA|nr:hypothetical protein ARMGADRAFT_1081899 [Armillaria gallica]